MTLKPPENGTTLEVKRCGKFLEDDRFEAIRRTVNTPKGEVAWPPKKRDMNPQNDFLRLTSQADSIFFLGDRFELVVDVRGFAPEEIQCVVTHDVVEVTAKRDERQGGQGYSSENSQNATRRYQLPQKINPYRSACFLSSDGVLAVTAMWAR